MSMNRLILGKIAVVILMFSFYFGWFVFWSYKGVDGSFKSATEALFVVSGSITAALLIGWLLAGQRFWTGLVGGMVQAAIFGVLLWVLRLWFGNFSPIVALILLYLGSSAVIVIRKWLKRHEADPGNRARG
jgi:hypothetical protein